MTNCWKSCSVPFCPHMTYGPADQDKICGGHAAFVRRSFEGGAALSASDWALVILDAVMGGLCGLPGAGDERKARNRAEAKKQRQAAIQ